MDKLSRRPNETEFAHHKRLVYGKLVDGTLADEDYSELAPYIFGKDYSSDVARRMMYGSRYTLELMDKTSEGMITSEEILSVLDAKKIEIQKEQQKNRDQRTALNKLIYSRARQEELNELITEAVLGGGLPSLDYSPVGFKKTDKDLLVSLNDVHYGADVDNYWNKYNSEICKEMLCRYLEQIIDVGRLHDCENCIVWANGDLINGNIHHSLAVTNKENVIEQITGISELIAEFLAELSHHFVTVQFVSVAGNHSRLDIKDKALKDERLDDLVEWYLKARLQHFENVLIGECDKIDSTMYLLDIRGNTYCGVHGDYDGSAAKIQTLGTMARRPVYAVLSGHKHHNEISTVQGIKTVMAGSFLGMDDFCVSRRIYGEPEQMICVCDEGGIRCSYDAKLK